MDRRRCPLAHGIWVTCIALLTALPVSAELLPPGDLRLRHEIQLLADAGVIDAPITGWPLFLTGIDTGSVNARELDPGTISALRSVFPAREPREALRVDVVAAGIGEPERLRGFQDMPREEGEITGRLAWERGRFAVDLQATRVDDPADGRESRLDGSYLGVAFGNWFLAASATDRWWGPGWDGSLVLSNNARPVPAITLQRREALPVTLRGFRWMGAWTTQVLFGKLESDRDHPDAQLFGWRVGFKPLPKLEVGLSRTAQWCGDGRPCGFDTFVDLLTGIRDNAGQNVARQDEPGNQLAGWDLRYAFRALGRPLAFYTQWIGEDEQNGLPSAYMAQLGLETWNALGTSGGSYRVHAEYADTACSAITDSDPNFGCAYEHSIYTDGYRYRSRVIGHTLDGDGRMFSVGALFVTGAGDSWHILARRAEINRSDNGRHSLTTMKQNTVTLEVAHTRYLPIGELTLGLGQEATELAASGTDFDETRAFVRWRRRLIDRR